MRARELIAAAIGAVVGLTLHGTVVVGQSSVGASMPLTPQQQEVLRHLQLVSLDNGQGGYTRTLRISGVNVQIVNGLGDTNSTNGTGNLVIGYNDLGNQVFQVLDDRSGSHNLILGDRQSYTANAAIIGGDGNASTETAASVIGGRGCHADGSRSVIVSGLNNKTIGDDSALLAGRNNLTIGERSAVIAGRYNETLATSSAILAGEQNATGVQGKPSDGFASAIASGRMNNTLEAYSTIVGGEFNTTSSTSSSYNVIVGGRSNETADPGYLPTHCVIVGGEQNGASGRRSVVVGGYSNRSPSDEGVAVGGEGNNSIGDRSVVAGGLHRAAVGTHDWRAGALSEDQ